MRFLFFATNPSTRIVISNTTTPYLKGGGKLTKIRSLSLVIKSIGRILDKKLIMDRITIKVSPRNG